MQVDCKWFIPAHEDVLRMLKVWCCHAPKKLLQRDHKATPTSIEDAPEDDVLEDQYPDDDLIPETVIPDTEYDQDTLRLLRADRGEELPEAEGGGEKKAAKSKKRKSDAKPKKEAKAKPKVKSKGKAKAKPKAAPKEKKTKEKK